MEGLPLLTLWDNVVSVQGTEKSKALENKYQDAGNQHNTRLPRTTEGNFELYAGLLEVDYVPKNIDPIVPYSHLVIFEDNDAVIKMIMKGRARQMRHVQRTHRINLDGMFEQIHEDPGLFLRYVGAKQQLGDLLTKGSFSAETWNSLCKQSSIGPSLRK